ncbi:MAG TPA: PIG-L family deacetylase [Marmoricola sp.]|nr:PIG-L family deacetylase [Marmoricola sp.]
MPRLRVPEDLGTVLSVWAHPDDETYLAGGVMAGAADAGRRVVCATASAGESGTADRATWPPERLGRVRRWEAAAAMSVLGVREHHVRGLPDGALPDHEQSGLAWVVGLLEDVQPDTVLTFGPDGITFHPDHIAVHRWVTQAWEDTRRRARLLYATETVERLEQYGHVYEEWGVYMTDERPTGVRRADLAVHLQLTGAALDRKVTALSAMASQTAALIAAVGAERFAQQVAEESFVQAR